MGRFEGIEKASLLNLFLHLEDFIVNIDNFLLDNLKFVLLKILISYNFTFEYLLQLTLSKFSLILQALIFEA